MTRRFYAKRGNESRRHKLYRIRKPKIAVLTAEKGVGTAILFSLGNDRGAGIEHIAVAHAIPSDKGNLPLPFVIAYDLESPTIRKFLYPPLFFVFIVERDAIFSRSFSSIIGDLRRSFL